MIRAVQGPPLTDSKDSQTFRTDTKKFDLTASELSGRLLMNLATFNGPVIMEGAKIGGGISFSASTAVDAVSLDNVDVKLCGRLWNWRLYFSSTVLDWRCSSRWRDFSLDFRSAG